MFVSVIIPTFNRSSLVLRAINSVLAQDYTNYEIIVVDDGSTDDTQEVLFELIESKKIKYHRQDNRGVSAARNYGVKLSCGDVISFLDSDDLWLTNKLSTQVEYLKMNSALDFVHSEEVWIRNDKIVNLKNKHAKHGDDIFIRSFDLCLISPSTVMMKKSLFDEMLGFREDFIVCEDYDLWLKILSLYDIGYISTPLVHKYGGHEDQLSTKFFAMDYWRIKSLYWLISNRNLGENILSVVKEVILKKSKQLLNGYLKHNNLDNYDEIKAIEEYALTLH